MKNIGIASVALASALVLVLFAVSVAPAMAQLTPPTPYMANGYVFYEDGRECNGSVVTVTNQDTGEEWEAETSSSSNYYELVLDSSKVSVGNVLHFDAKDPDATQFYTTDHTVTSDEMTAGGLLNFNLSLTLTAVTHPDLLVSEIKLNCGYIFANESNEISATVKNNGTANATAFNVSITINSFSEEVRVTGLAAGNSTTITVTDPTLRNADVSVTITVTADCNAEIVESNETNNASALNIMVVNNGYKGKRYTGGEDINTWKTHELKGNLLYSVGDSYYLSASTYPHWTTYDVSWTASDLPVPGGATIEEARLYVPYTWDKKGVMPTYVSLSFNGEDQTLDAHYSDEKMHATSYPYGMLAYDVTADFNTAGNVANLTNSYPGGGNVSIRGMLLVVIYADDSEAKRKIIMNEEFDLLYGGSGKCTTPAEATAYAPFGAIDLSGIEKATLITVAPGAGPNEGDLLFNGQTWYNVWNFGGSSQIGINETDVTSFLQSTDNDAGFQSSKDWMEASNAFLVVEYEEEVVLMPDLEITDIWCELLREGKKADNYYIHYNITNNGDADASRIVSNLTVDGTAMKKKSRVKSLAAGSTTTGSFRYRSATPPDTIMVCADWWDRIVESNETNNCLEVTEVTCTVA